MSWGCIHTYNGMEERVVENLGRVGHRLDGNVSYEAFCPHYARPNPTKPTEYREVPLFPGYVFVKFDAERPWHSINSTRGVIRMLTTRSGSPRPLMLDDRVIDGLRISRLSGKLLAPDTRVKVRKAGSLQGFEGTVLRLTAAQRIVVLMSFFDRTTEVEFTNSGDLEVLE